MLIIELADGTLIAFNSDGTELQNGNTKVSLSELVDDPIVPCFTPGTQILTPNGYVFVETLQDGDLIETRDNGAQPVRKILRHLTAIRGAPLHHRRIRRVHALPESYARLPQVRHGAGGSVSICPFPPRLQT